MLKFLIISSLLLSLLSCKKLETDPPKVNILLPGENDTLQLSDSIQIQCEISDKNLRTYKIIIYNYFTRKLFYNEEGSTANSSISIDKKVFFDITADTTAFINILGIDANGNTGGAGQKFYIIK